MICPHCATPRLKIVETYTTPERVWRTRKCDGCGYRFTTHEEISEDLTIPKSVRNVNRKQTKE